MMPLLTPLCPVPAVATTQSQFSPYTLDHSDNLTDPEACRSKAIHSTVSVPFHSINSIPQQQFHLEEAGSRMQKIVRSRQADFNE